MTKTYSVTLAVLRGYADTKYKIVSVEYIDDLEEALLRYRTYPRPSRNKTYKITLHEITPKQVLHTKELFPRLCKLPA